LPEGSYVRISVFDINGRHVRDLINSDVSAGVHQLIWNADQVSAGVYMLQMKAEPINGKAIFKEVKKVILVK